MIDEKKIEEAAEEQLENLGAYGLDEVDLGKENQVTLYREKDVKAMFMAGINWFKENLWHDASEEPRDKSTILLKYTGPFCEWATLDEVDADDWNDTVKELGITRWLYIEDLMKGGK